jgi:hypothetical protein
MRLFPRRNFLSWLGGIIGLGCGGMVQAKPKTRAELERRYARHQIRRRRENEAAAKAIADRIDAEVVRYRTFERKSGKPGAVFVVRRQTGQFRMGFMWFPKGVDWVTQCFGLDDLTDESIALCAAEILKHRHGIKYVTMERR